MNDLQVMNQHHKLGTIQIPLTVEPTSPYYKYYDINTFSWTFPVARLTGKYRFKLSKMDLSTRANNPTDMLYIISPQLKMLFSPVADMTMVLNTQRPYFDPIIRPIEFVSNCDGVLNFNVRGAGGVGVFPQFFTNVILTYDVYLF